MSQSLLALGSSPLKLGLLCALSVGASAFTLACGENDSTAAKCKTGDILPCTCEGGRPSTRSCTSDVFTECQCGGLIARDAGSDGSDMQSIADSALSDAELLDAELVDRSCGTQSSTGVVKDARPIDLIFVIDNSGSMSEEIGAIETNINDNLARILDERGVDYRVIMVTTHGAHMAGSGVLGVCIRAPLSNTTCNPIPALPANGPRFFHYNREVQSTDSWCQLLSSFAAPGTAAPQGWRSWLRTDSLKVFIEVTDDDINCQTSFNRENDAGVASVSLSARGVDAGNALVTDQGGALALAFQDALFKLSPSQFGTPEKPNYVWHSMIAIKPNQPPTAPWGPTSLIQTEKCASGVNSAPGYQALSIMSQGLRYPVCDGAGFDSMFLGIARKAVQSSNVECRFQIPDPPVGKYVDRKSILVDYTPTGGAKEALQQVEASACNEGAFLVEENEVVLCDAACARVRADKTAQLQVKYSCGEPPVLR